MPFDCRLSALTMWGSNPTPLDCQSSTLNTSLVVRALDWQSRGIWFDPHMVRALNRQSKGIGFDPIRGSSFFSHKLWYCSKEQFSLFSITINDMRIYKKNIHTYVLYKTHMNVYIQFQLFNMWESCIG